MYVCIYQNPLMSYGNILGEITKKLDFSSNFLVSWIGSYIVKLYENFDEKLLFSQKVSENWLLFDAV